MRLLKSIPFICGENEIKDSISYLVSNTQDIRFRDKIIETKKLVYRYRYKEAKVMVKEIMDSVKESYNE